LALHCASILGFIDYVYNQRHDISIAVGLIEEAPITLCGSRYEHPKTFKITDHQERKAPESHPKAHRINLFFASTHQIQNKTIGSDQNDRLDHFSNLYSFSLIDFAFRPPAQA
jgi:hypothetical protein